MIYWFLSLSTILVLLVIIAIVLLQRKIVLQQRQISRLQQDVEALCIGALGMSDRIRALDKRNRLSADSQESTVELDDVAKELESNQDRTAVMKKYGINKGEADLLQLMRRYRGRIPR